MIDQEFPRFVVVPDITTSKHTVYRVMRILDRNEEGSYIFDKEPAESFRDSDEADRKAEQLNRRSEEG